MWQYPLTNTAQCDITVIVVQIMLVACKQAMIDQP